MTNMQIPSPEFEPSNFSNFSVPHTTAPIPLKQTLPDSSDIVEIKITKPPLYFGPNIKELIERSASCEIVIALLHVKFMGINYLALNDQGGHKGALDYANQQIERLGFKSSNGYEPAKPVGGGKAILLPEPARILIFSNISNEFGTCKPNEMAKLIKAAIPDITIEIDLGYLQKRIKKN